MVMPAEYQLDWNQNREVSADKKLLNRTELSPGNTKYRLQFAATKASCLP